MNTSNPVSTIPTTTHSHRPITESPLAARSEPLNTHAVIGHATMVASTPATIRPLYSAFMILPPGEVLTNITPMIDAMIEKPPSTSGYITASIVAPVTISEPSSIVAISVTA